MLRVRASTMPGRFLCFPSLQAAMFTSADGTEVGRSGASAAADGSRSIPAVPKTFRLVSY